MIKSRPRMRLSYYFKFLIPEQNRAKYGELFKIVLRYNVRHCVKSTGYPDDLVLACSGDELIAPTYVRK